MSRHTEEQLNFINYNGDNSIILSAIAGSGKTHSTVGRVNKMISDGINPERIIFFSFTNDAVNELKSRIKHDVKITTIHSFTSSLLGKMGLFKPITTFYDFTNWYKEKYKPHPKDPLAIKMEYARNVDRFYEEGNQISATFSAYKLQSSDGIKVLKPKYYNEYAAFIKETKSRDFSDMLIDTEKYSRDPKYKKYFENLYDYVFVDEYQDTSTLQMKILGGQSLKGPIDALQNAITFNYYANSSFTNQGMYKAPSAEADNQEKYINGILTTEQSTLSDSFNKKVSAIQAATAVATQIAMSPITH